MFVCVRGRDGVCAQSWRGSQGMAGIYAFKLLC